jgi:hypothetical protein
MYKRQHYISLQEPVVPSTSSLTRFVKLVLGSNLTNLLTSSELTMSKVGTSTEERKDSLAKSLSV